MSLREGLTIAICTRNRPDELRRCVASIAGQEAAFPLEVLIADDGELPETLLSELRAALAPTGAALVYLRKRRPGLLYSRIEAAEAARSAYILYLDDDAELTPGYLERLAATYERYPQAAAVGGIDANLSFTRRWQLFTRLILHDSGRPGRLSASGYGGSMSRWSAAAEPFLTEYLLGCNMSFRVRALRGLPAVDWLTGYSLGEDLYLSCWASRGGELIIDPALRVRHEQSSVSRDRQERVAYTEIVNHHYLLALRQPKAWRYAAHLWTSCGLLVRALLAPRMRPMAAGYARGIRFLLAEARRRWRRERVAHSGDGRAVGRGGDVPGKSDAADAQPLRGDSGRPERRRTTSSAD